MSRNISVPLTISDHKPPASERLRAFVAYAKDLGFTPDQISGAVCLTKNSVAALTSPPHPPHFSRDLYNAYVKTLSSLAEPVSEEDWLKKFYIKLFFNVPAPVLAQEVRMSRTSIITTKGNIKRRSSGILPRNRQ